jgi:hypothetical protein
MVSPNIPGRRNGLSRPYTFSQISAWIALIATLLQFLLIVSPILPLVASIPVTVVFCALVGSVSYYGFLTSIIDPMDIRVRTQLEDTKQSCLYEKFNPLPSEEEKEDDNNDAAAAKDEALKQCWLCDTQVADVSMHCKFCNKCVYVSKEILRVVLTTDIIGRDRMNRSLTHTSFSLRIV